MAEISKHINQIIQELKTRPKGGSSKIAHKFTRKLFANVPPDDVRGESPANLAGGTLALWNTLQQRKPGTAKVNVYNPDPKTHGWDSTHTIIEIVNDDMPFLVDSITSAINSLGGEVHLVIHPIMAVKRDGRGKLTALQDEPGARGSIAESVMHVQISEQSDDRLPDIKNHLEMVLDEVRMAVEDWRSMRQRCRDLVAELEENPPPLPYSETAEGAAFLKWMDDDHFTFLGYREYRFEGRGAQAVSKIDPKSGLGLLRDREFRIFEGLRNLGKLPGDIREFVRSPVLLRITKANRRSNIHRPARLDAIAIKVFDKKGKVQGERLFVGLFTSTAYSRSPRSIPLLREKVDNVMRRSGFSPGSHDGKALMHILETYPRDELFEISEAELLKISLGVLHLQERQRTALFVREDSFGRYVSCMIYVPRDRYDTNLRLKLQDILAEAYDGSVTTYSTQLGDAALARIHVVVTTRKQRLPGISVNNLEEKLAEAARSWVDLLADALVETRGEQQGIKTLRRFERGLPAGYQDHFDQRTACADIGLVEHAIAEQDLAMNLHHREGEPDHALHFKLYVGGDPVPLSDVLPMLENMGLKVIGEVPYPIRPAGHHEPVWIHDFDMHDVGDGDLSLDSVRDSFHDVFYRVWHGSMENDGFNKLVLRAGLNARQIIILRAYCKYLRQARIPFSQAYMEETLANNPAITRLLVELFETRFDPALAKGAGKKATKLIAAVKAALDEVANLDEDRIIRRYLNMIETTLRTNFYQPAAGGEEKTYLSFKLDSGNIEELPLPRPFREIFVYSPKVEGVHLRFGMVARGGLRWSDRREDFRTEILGLVKAQQVKNAVIVPVGSKGGFVMKAPPPPEAGRDAYLAEGIESYKTFIRGLLDITDNLKVKKLVPPKSVVRYDGDDPYLVVAADKGTATFSDIANGVSIDYGHWLDDAFASGGSAGYDHKKMGITARGGWESVKRHFRELGKDIQNEDFTCVGCGDMAGDVFGNGMLLSKHIKLVGAFNHMHIFVDPNPDSAKSWVERKRLFDLPRSAWTDYNAKLISKGGGIFDRRAKSIKTTPQMRSLFEIDKAEVTPNELIKAMLLAPTELLWFGGIGTYVKASSESDLEVGDRANDPLRINGKQVGAKVVGEGANLGMTQLARIEYGLAGGHSNTDSIDNSAGVDCSDHEVNIKILLGAVEQAGGMTRKQRDNLLEKMTDEVAEQCLRDNYLQSQAITITHLLGAHLLDRFARYMRVLEKADQLNRAIEFLPDDEEVADRLKQGVGLARPEIAVLLSYSKIVLYDELLDSSLPDDLYFKTDLINYFPAPLRKKYAKEIGDHRLRREIITTVITNDLVNRVGITFIHEVRQKTGMPADEITKAYIVAREIFGMRNLWDQIEALDNKVPALLQSRLLLECGRLIERIAVWFLREGGYPLSIEESIAAFGPGAKILSDQIIRLVAEGDRAQLEEHAAEFVRDGAPKALAQQIASLNLLVSSCDIIRIASASGLATQDVADLYFKIGERFGFDYLRRAAAHLPTDTAWDKLAVTAIIDDFFGHQGEMASNILAGKGKSKSLDSVVEVWTSQRKPMVDRSEQLMVELKSAGTPDFAMLAVANRALKSLVSG
ncbi:MAG: NAD-glutamate dehydrogenase [Pseudomonadota bacterium]